MKKLLLLILCFAIACTGLGCSPVQKTQVAATTLPVYEFTSLLCEGTGIGVTRLVTEEVSCLHDYSLQTRQMRAIENADVIVISGGGLETFLDDALTTKQTVIDASHTISLHCGDEHDHEHHDHSHENDPHYWLDPENAKIMVQNICQGLIEQFPKHKEAFLKNQDALLQKLDQLQQHGQEQLKNLSCHELVTFHDGFGYLAESFGLSVLEAIEEESGSEASAQELIHLIQLVQQHKLPAIFTEKSGSVSAASIISAETGVLVFTLDMAMSGDSYFDAMYHNIDTLKEALG